MVGPDGVHVPAGTFEVLLPLQVVAVQVLPTAANAFVQVGTGAGPAIKGNGQVVVVQLLPIAAICGVQVPTGTLVVVIGAGQVVVV